MSDNGLIDCSNFEERIHQILDDRLTLTGDKLLMTHASKCAQCDEILKDYNSVEDSIKLLPADLAKILAESQKPNSRARLTQTVTWVAAIAALVFLAINVMNTTPRSPESRMASVSHPSLAIASPISGPNRKKSATRVTPDTSPFSPNFSVANSMPSIPAVPTWDDISRKLDPIQPRFISPVLDYSNRIPALRPVHCSVKATISFLKQSLGEQEPVQDNPDLGFTIDPMMFATA